MFYNQSAWFQKYLWRICHLNFLLLWDINTCLYFLISGFSSHIFAWKFRQLDVITEVMPHFVARACISSLRPPSTWCVCVSLMTQSSLRRFAAVKPSNQILPRDFLQTLANHLWLMVTWAAPTCSWEPMALVFCAILDAPPSCILFLDITVRDTQRVSGWAETWRFKPEAP